MRLTWRLGANLATVLLLGIITVGWVVSNIIGNGFFNPPFEVVADFRSTGGVFTNQEVTYRGVLIGKVGDLELNDNNGVNVHLLIDREWNDKIPEDVAARVQNKSAVGEQFVNLTPLSDDGPYLTAGDEIARENTELPVDFQALLRSLDTVLADIPPEQVNRFVTNLADGLGGRGDDIGSILQSLSDLSVAFADAAPEQQRLLDNATRAGAEFLRTKDEFTAAMQAADDVLEGLGDEPGELAAFFAANDRIARRGSALLARHGDNLADGIDGLADFTEFQNENKDSVIQSLEYVPQFLQAIEDSSVPWVDEDGSRYYRIRVGLVFDNVERSWPCKYQVPDQYERFQFERAARRPYTGMQCEKPADDADQVRALVSELKAWAREHRDSLEEEPGAPEPLSVGIEAAAASIFQIIPTATATPEPTPSTTPTPTP